MKTHFIFLCLIVSGGFVHATTQTKADPDKPARLYVKTYTDTEDGSQASTDTYQDASGNATGEWDSYVETGNTSGSWSDNGGGSSSWTWQGIYAASHVPIGTNYAWYDVVYQTNAYPDIGVASVNASDDDLDTPFTVNMEHCDLDVPLIDTSGSYLQNMGGGNFDYQTEKDTGSRHAQATMILQTGGKAVSRQENLFCLGATAAQILCVKTPIPVWANPPPPAVPPVLPQNIQIMGESLDTNGNLYVVLPDNDTLDVTPQLQGVDYYTFTENQQKYTPTLTANDVPLDPIAINVTNCVGQKTVFKLAFNPALPAGILITNQNSWVLPGNYVNAYEWFEPDIGSVLTNTCNGTYYLTTCDPAQTNYSRYAYSIDSPFCNFYQQSSWPLTQPETGAWWLSGGLIAVTCFPTLTFNNGQTVSLGDVHGNLYMLKPHITRVDTSNGPYGTQLLTNGLPPYLLWLDGGPMDFRVYISKTFPGKFGITQLVNMSSETIVISPIWTSTGGSYYLDKAQEYYETNLIQITNIAPNEESNQGSQIYDTPGQTLGTIEADYTGYWKDYVRFTPDGSDSIAVTIGRIDWNWAATALATPHWHITSDPSGVNGPSTNADDSFPTWTKSFPNGD